MYIWSINIWRYRCFYFFKKDELPKHILFLTEKAKKVPIRVENMQFHQAAQNLSLSLSLANPETPFNSHICFPDRHPSSSSTNSGDFRCFPAIFSAICLINSAIFFNLFPTIPETIWSSIFGSSQIGSCLSLSLPPFYLFLSISYRPDHLLWWFVRLHLILQFSFFGFSRLFLPIDPIVWLSLFVNEAIS